MDDTGMMVYHFKKDAPKENYLELKFCVTGNVYCNQKEADCGSCKRSSMNDCVNKVPTVDVLSFRFSDLHLSQFAKVSKTGQYSHRRYSEFPPSIFFFEDSLYLWQKFNGARSASQS